MAERHRSAPATLAIAFDRCCFQPLVDCSFAFDRICTDPKGDGMPFEQQSIDHESGVVILALSGTLTMGNQLMKLEWTVDELVADKRNKIVFDLSEVAYLDSAAIGVLINCRGKVVSTDGQLRIANPTERVSEILRIAKIYDFLAPDATREAAISKLA